MLKELTIDEEKSLPETKSKTLNMLKDLSLDKDKDNKNN